MELTCCYESVGLKVEKYLKPINQNEYGRPEDAPIREVGLEAIVVYVRSNVVPLNLHGPVCERSKHYDEGEAHQEGCLLNRVYVMFMDHHRKNPATVDRLTNQLTSMSAPHRPRPSRVTSTYLNTVSEPLDTFMKDRNANADYI